MKITTLLKCQTEHYLKFIYYRQLRLSYRNQQSNQYNAIFVHVPKSAGTAVLSSLFGRQTGLGHKSCKDYLKVYGINRYLSTFKFGFVRNPYDRLVSAYEYLQKGGNNSSDRMFFEQSLKPYKNFETFVLQGLLRDETIRRHIHFRPQTDFLCIDGRICVDFVGRYENIEADYAYLSRLLGKETALASANKSSRRESYQSYYKNQQVIDAVSSLYHRDFEKFRYDKDVSST